MNQDLVINLVPFKFHNSQIKIHYSDSSIEPRNVINSRHLFPDSEEEKKIFWDLSPFLDSKEYIVDETNLSILKKIATKVIRNFLIAKGLSVSHDFIEGLTILEPTENSHNPDLKIYKKYSVRVLAPKEQHACNPTFWCLNITFQGEVDVMVKPYSQYQAQETLISKVIVGNEIKKSKDLTDTEKQRSDTKVILSYKLRAALKIPNHFYKPLNKYARFYEETTKFYDRYLKGSNVENQLTIFESGFQPISHGQIKFATNSSNLLMFGENKTHFNPYMGLKEYGPHQPLMTDAYKFFFVFHEQDKEYANKLYGYLIKGLKGFPGLYRFVGLNLNLDKDKTVAFTSDNPVQEIKSSLEKMTFDASTKYLAIYISRIKKDEIDNGKRDIYFQLKKLFLEKNISSQVVYKYNIDDPSFNYFLPNISIAILAKLGGIPWRLSRPVKHDLVIGLGACKDEKNTLFLGTTVCFKNDGTFLQFNSSKTEKITDLIDFFKSILITIPKEQVDIKRLVIHYYKTMNSREELAIIKALDDLDLHIPYIVLHIVDEPSFLPFDLAYQGRMPSSGTCIIFRKGTYLLCNNTRYSNLTGSKIEGFPFPVEIKISKASSSELSGEDIQQLIDQVYQFSRMYWVSVKQKGRPVTILYSEKVAKVSSAFDNQQLPQSDVATKTLWFL